MSEYQFITTETLDDGAIVRIMLNRQRQRQRQRNGQSRGLPVELHEAFLAAEANDWRTS